MHWHIRKATADDVADIASRLRTEDAAECHAANGLSTYDALMLGLEDASVVIGADNRPIAIFGVKRLTPIAGAIWMAATPELTREPYVGDFIKQSRPICDELNTRYPLLCNVVDERNAVHIRWLEWCGFIFINRHETYGHEQRPFLEFIRIRPCANP